MTHASTRSRAISVDQNDPISRCMPLKHLTNTTDISDGDMYATDCNHNPMWFPSHYNKLDMWRDFDQLVETKRSSTGDLTSNLTSYV